ncbi:MAG: hypothetical protein R3Y52_03755 [Psittacicella sp.]
MSDCTNPTFINIFQALGFGFLGFTGFGVMANVGLYEKSRKI